MSKKTVITHGRTTPDGRSVSIGQQEDGNFLIVFGCPLTERDSSSHRVKARASSRKMKKDAVEQVITTFALSKGAAEILCVLLTERLGM